MNNKSASRTKHRNIESSYIKDIIVKMQNGIVQPTRDYIFEFQNFNKWMRAISIPQNSSQPQ